MHDALSVSEMSFCHGINNLLERSVTTLRERYERYWTIQQALFPPNIGIAL
jgi:hypothetical protein